MNASSLYVTVLRLVFQNDAPNVHRLFPYLRQLLSCSVCGNLLREPFSPLNSPCQHHECKTCVGGRKILKPSCAWCRDRPDTVQNVQLRLLLQCYKSLCEYIKLTPIYEGMQSQVQINSQSNSSAADHSGVGNRNRLADIIDEGIRFKDEFKSAAGLSKATYSMLPCLYQSVVTEPPAAVTPPPPPPPPPSQPTIVHQQQIHPQQQYIINSGGQIVLQKSMHSSSSSSPSNLLLQPPQQQPLQNQHLQKIQNPGGGGLIATLSNQRSLINSNSGSSSNSPIQPQTSGGVKQVHLPSSSINNSVTTNNNRIIQTTVAANGTVYVTKSQFVPPMPIIKTVSNGSALYSVMYAGSGNKITIKRKTDSQSASSAAHAHHNQQQLLSEGHKDPVEMGKTSSHPSSSSSSAAVSSSPTTNNSSLLLQGSSGSMTSSNYVVQDGGGGDPGAGLGFKKPPMVVKSKTLAKRKGCRCGNATLTPGKLTCCGQRCPCYVESKSCIDCKCRGCRNPHRPNGFKVRPHIPELENLDFHLHAVEQQSQQQQPLMKTILNTLSIVGNQQQQQQHAVASSSNSSSSPASSSSLVKVSNMAATSSSSNNVDDGIRMDSRLNGIIGGTRTTEGLCDLGSNLNLHSFQSGGGGNVPQGKIQVLNVYTTPSNLSQMNSGLPTIIMGMGGSSNSSSGNQGGLGTTTTVTGQLQETLGSSASGSAYSFSNGSIYTTSNGRGSAGTGQGMSTTYTLSGSQHLGQSNMSFQSFFGDDILGSGAVVAENLDDTLDDEDVGGVIIGSYSTDEDELSSPQQIHLNGGGGDSSAEDELDV